MSFVNGVEVVGQTFVTVEFPPIHVFPIFYMKPITWLTFAIILFTYSTLELYRERITTVSDTKTNLALLVSFIVASLSAYELLFNFTLWGGLIASGSLLGNLNPDIIVNPFPNPQIPWNIVFATKMYFSLTVVGLYFFYFVSKVKQERKIYEYLLER